MRSRLAGLRLADVSKEEILIFLDPTSLTNTGGTFFRNAEKNKIATLGLRTDRQTDRQQWNWNRETQRMGKRVIGPVKEIAPWNI